MTPPPKKTPKPAPSKAGAKTAPGKRAADSPAPAQNPFNAPCNDKERTEPIWDRLTKAELESMEALPDEYGSLLSEAKTERELGRILLEKAAAAG